VRARWRPQLQGWQRCKDDGRLRGALLLLLLLLLLNQLLHVTHGMVI
jgi:hypothetical protein